MFRPSWLDYRRKLTIPGMASTKTCETNIVRRSGNYNPTIWNSDYIESLESNK